MHGTLSDELSLASHSSGVPSQVPLEMPSRRPSEMPPQVPMGQEANCPTSHTPEGPLFVQAQPYLEHSLQADDMQQPALLKSGREGDRAKTHSREGLTEKASRGVGHRQVRAVHHPHLPSPSSLAPQSIIGLSQRQAWVDHKLLFNHAQRCSVFFRTAVCYVGCIAAACSPEKSLLCLCYTLSS